MYVISETDGRWEETKARTLTGAKRMATWRFGAGFIDHTIYVGWKEDDGQIRVHASKRNGARSKWEYHP